MRGVFYFVGYATMVDEALYIAEIKAITIGTRHPALASLR